MNISPTTHYFFWKILGVLNDMALRAFSKASSILGLYMRRGVVSNNTCKPAVHTMSQRFACSTSMDTYYDSQSGRRMAVPGAAGIRVHEVKMSAAASIQVYFYVWCVLSIWISYMYVGWYRGVTCQDTVVLEKVSSRDVLIVADWCLLLRQQISPSGWTASESSIDERLAGLRSILEHGVSSVEIWRDYNSDEVEHIGRWLVSQSKPCKLAARVSDVSMCQLHDAGFHEVVRLRTLQTGFRTMISLSSNFDSCNHHGCFGTWFPKYVIEVFRDFGTRNRHAFEIGQEWPAMFFPKP